VAAESRKGAARKPDEQLSDLLSWLLGALEPPVGDRLAGAHERVGERLAGIAVTRG
jgi:hypothetical protein